MEDCEQSIQDTNIIYNRVDQSSTITYWTRLDSGLAVSVASHLLTLASTAYVLIVDNPS